MYQIKLFSMFFTAVCLALIPAATSSAGDQGSLEEQVRILMKQNRMLMKKVEQLEGKVEAMEGAGDAGYVTKKELDEFKKGHNEKFAEIESELDTMEGSIGQRKIEAYKQGGVNDVFNMINDHVSLSGLVELEAFGRDDYDSNSESEVTLATAELGIDAYINDWVGGHMLLLWEEGETDGIEVDEAIITLGNVEKFPLFLDGGRMYVPFGTFESNMIQDPLTLEIGETRETALQLGFDMAGFRASLYGFNGDTKDYEGNERIENWGCALGYGHEFQDLGLTIEADAGIINSIGDSDAIQDILQSPVHSHTAGLAAQLLVSYGSFSFIGEYLGALTNFKSHDMNFRNEGAEPQSWNLELAYSTELFEREFTFAAGYQGTKDALALELPMARYMASIGVAAFKNTVVTLEYLHDEDYGETAYVTEPDEVGGTGNSADQVTMQIAVEF
ncbi:MAG TPA: LbtU family siderophore porin [Thermodesulfobacteriaceae bacterium]|nr:LbtU family siderophore porin [Thermodesulfobacteriaceae bacterium]